MRKKTVEDYLESIYDLQKEKKRVHTNDIAELLQISPASVTEIFQKLSDEGYLSYEKYSGVIVTTKGKKLARKTKKKHDTVKEFLVLLGVSKKIAEEDACEMEHILHPKTLEMIIRFVEVINQCRVAPFWLQRLRNYYRTGDLAKCPQELSNMCIKYSRKLDKIQ
jgi:DtxR family Mn-dependent transcriptional regulator